MIHTLSFVIQQPLFSAQPSWIIFNKVKVRGGLDNVSGRSGADELNSWLLIGIYLYKIPHGKRGIYTDKSLDWGIFDKQIKPKNDKKNNNNNEN